MRLPRSRRSALIGTTVVLLVVALLLVRLLIPQPRPSREEVTVFAAASLTNVLETLAADFERMSGKGGPGSMSEGSGSISESPATISESSKSTGESFGERGARYDVVLNFAASNTLARQLAAAPAGDLFISAHPRWVDFLQERGRIRRESRRTLWSNALAVIAHPSVELSVEEAASLCRAQSYRLSLADPAVVPAGVYAREWLQSVECESATLWERLSDNVVPAHDVRAALAAVESHPGFLGVVYRSDALSSDRILRLFDVPAAQTPEIRYPAAVIAGDHVNAAGAQAFLAYLQSAPARETLERFGFLPIHR